MWTVKKVCVTTEEFLITGFLSAFWPEGGGGGGGKMRLCELLGGGGGGGQVGICVAKHVAGKF